MNRPRKYTFRDMEKILKKNGYSHVRSKGSHKIYSNGKRTISVNVDLNKVVALRLIKENKLNIF